MSLDQTVSSNPSRAESLRPSEGARREIEAVFERIQWLTAQHRAPGISVQIQVGDEHFQAAAGVRSVRGDEPMSPDACIPMGCITKSLMALACVYLHRQGQLNLLAPATEYLPELRGGQSGPQPSLANLLSHSGGFIEPQYPAPFQELSWDRFVAFFCNRPQVFQPGSVWSYTQTGHAIVARVLERLTGTPTLEYLKRKILDPLGLGPADIGSRTANLASCAAPHVFSERSQRYEAIRIPADSGFFRESISDIPLSSRELLILGRALNAQRGELGDPEVIALLRKPQIEIEPQALGADAEMSPQAYGLGLGRYGTLWGVTGSFLGSTCAIRACPERSLVIVLAMNTWAPGLRDRLLTRLMKSLAGFKRPPENATSSGLDAWIGDYEGLALGSGTLSIVATEDGMLCTLRRAQGEQKIRIAVSPDGSFRIRSGSAASIGFHTEPCGNAPYVRVGTVAYGKLVTS